MRLRNLCLLLSDCSYNRFTDANDDTAAERETATGVVHPRRKTKALSFNAHASSCREEFFSIGKGTYPQKRRNPPDNEILAFITGLSGFPIISRPGYFN